MKGSGFVQITTDPDSWIPKPYGSGSGFFSFSLSFFWQIALTSLSLRCFFLYRTHSNLPPLYVPVLWIRDILVRIRIRLFVPLSYGYGPGSCSFRRWLSRCFFCFLKVHLRPSSRIKSHKEVAKDKKSCVKKNLLNNGKIQIRIRTNNDGSWSWRPRNQCCGPGSGIRCLFDPWIWYPD